MNTIIGLKALKDEWRRAKLIAGDMRGLKNAFQLARKFNMSEFKVYYDSTAKKEGKIEIEASIYRGSDCLGSAYNLKDIADIVKGESEPLEIQLVKLQWNKWGTDAERSNIGTEFIYINLNPAEG